MADLGRYETAVCFKYKHSDHGGGTSDGCSVVLVVSPLVSLINYGSHRRVNTAATLQAVYLVWLFLRITTTCNLSIIGLVREKFPESFAHAQTVDTRPLFPPPTWPGYEARAQKDGLEFSLTGAVTGLHVYRRVWLPHLGQHLSTEREHVNAEDRFAIAVTEHSDMS